MCSKSWRQTSYSFSGFLHFNKFKCIVQSHINLDQRKGQVPISTNTVRHSCDMDPETSPLPPPKYLSGEGSVSPLLYRQRRTSPDTTPRPGGPTQEVSSSHDVTSESVEAPPQVDTPQTLFFAPRPVLRASPLRETGVVTRPRGPSFQYW